VDLDAPSLALAGRLDVRSAGRVRHALHTALDRGSAILVVELAGVEVMDGSGLGVLIGAHRRAEASGRRLVLRGASPRLLAIFRLMRLDRVLHLEPLPSAPSAAGAPAP
jgi:anti-sigma B factor antagonist